MEAMEREMKLLDDQPVFGYLMEEWDDVRAKDPNATKVGTRMILSEKFFELMLPEEAKEYKGRFIAQGCYVQDARGRKVHDKVDHDAPVTMSEARTLLALGMQEEDAVAYHGDVKGAYITSKLRGRKVYARIDRRHWFPRWREQEQKRGGFRDPVTRVIYALYGLERSDKDWSDHRNRTIAKKDWVRVTASVWMKNFTVEVNHKAKAFIIRAGIYVDDCLITGDRTAGAVAYKELHALLGFSKATPQLMSIFLGMHSTPIRQISYEGEKYDVIFLSQDP